MDLKQYIIENINQELVFSKYLGISIEDIRISIIDNCKILNSYRYEKSPSLKFKYYNDKLIARDFGDNRYSGDIFEVVGNIINKDCRSRQGFIDICSDIIVTCTKDNADIIIAKEREEKELSKNNTIIEYNSRKPNRLNYIFYEQFGINEEYFNKNVEVVDSYYINGRMSPYRYTGCDPCYAYRVNPNKIKLYFPFRTKKDIRFITNNRVPIENIDNIKKTDYTIIIKSIKDKILFDRIITEKNIKNIQILSAASETVNIPNDIHTVISKYTNKDNIYSLFDNDSAGIKGMIHLEETLGIHPIYFTLGYDSKDPTDMVKKYGYNKVYEQFDLIIKKILKI